jgi:hypothetical protein
MHVPHVAAFCGSFRATIETSSYRYYTTFCSIFLVFFISSCLTFILPILFVFPSSSFFLSFCSYFLLYYVPAFNCSLPFSLISYHPSFLSSSLTFILPITFVSSFLFLFSFLSVLLSAALRSYFQLFSSLLTYFIPS